MLTTPDGSGISELNLDFPDAFQIHIRNIFAGSYSVLDMYSAKSFYTDLFDFAPEGLLDKKPLMQLLNEHSIGWSDGGCWVLVIAKVPALFCNWWAQQMLALWSSGWNLTFHLVLLSDALPCSWEAQSLLVGSRLDAQRLQTYVSQTTLLDPCVRTRRVVCDTYVCSR